MTPITRISSPAAHCMHTHTDKYTGNSMHNIAPMISIIYTAELIIAYTGPDYTVSHLILLFIPQPGG